MLCYKTKNDAVHHFFHPSLGDFHHSQSPDPSLAMKLYILPHFQTHTLSARYPEGASYYTFVSQLQTHPPLYLAL